MTAVTEFATKIRISPNPPVFDLPILVALEHGLFAKVGLDVDYSVKYADHDKLEKDVLKRQKEALFEAGAAESFNVCEWGGIDRLERGTGRGKIAALRPAIAAQAIVSFDPKLQSPRDLAGVAIGINDFTGSHYTTIGLLEGAIPKDQVVTTHIGAPEVRLQAMKEGRVRAVTVMEPFISLALKQGAHLIALTFYRGAEIVSQIFSLSTSTSTSRSWTRQWTSSMPTSTDTRITSLRSRRTTSARKSWMVASCAIHMPNGTRPISSTRPTTG